MMAKQTIRFPCGLTIVKTGWFMMYDNVEELVCPLHKKDCKSR